MEITVVGTGNMGSAFIRRAHMQGFKVYMWNRDREKARGLPGVAIDKLEEARGLAAIFVSDDLALRQVARELGGDYVALCGTYSVGAVREVIEELSSRGKKAFAMPVVGSPRNVENGDAVYIVGAPEEIYMAVRPTLEKLGVLFYVGDSEKAAALKLAYNSLLISTVAVLGEALTLATRYGIAPHQLRELMRHTVFREVAERYIDRMTSHVKPTFTIKHAAKDLRYASNAAGEGGVGSVVVNGVKSLYELLTALGFGEEDYVRAGILEGGR
ncbi:MAG: NAD(P)-dependent oxidoreductase [Pyrobaculum sp.]